LREKEEWLNGITESGNRNRREKKSETGTERRRGIYVGRRRQKKMKQKGRERK
jgi:hypothetical protein